MRHRTALTPRTPRVPSQVKRHVRPRPGAPGGVIAKESPVHYSNVALLDPPTG